MESPTYVKLTEEEKDKAIDALRVILFKRISGGIGYTFMDYVDLAEKCPILKKVFDEKE